MKQILALLLAMLMLTGCAGNTIAEVTSPEVTAETSAAAEISFGGSMAAGEAAAPEYVSRFDSETIITLSDDGITVEGNEEAVYPSHDIIYYEDRDSYDSGNPYGEGKDHERHTAGEAASHTVVNITAPGAYRVSGKLSAGQIRVDLGEDAYFDPDAVVELILDDAEIICTVAPAILFLNTYECDGEWSTDDASPDVDTTAAGANLILEGQNMVSGSHVARIYKDKEGEKKLWKQDGAVYSYMSANVFGPGSLEIFADNEGLNSELHLTINGGDLRIFSHNDGINTNEDGVSVTTINGGTVHIVAGVDTEGDGIDSNGYLVINGGTVIASANPASDAGLDSDLGSYINGGIVVALGSTMDWAESDSAQVTMNLQFADRQDGGSAIVVTREDGTVVFAYDPSEDALLKDYAARQYQGAILSCPGFTQGDTYQVWLNGTLTGEETGGVYTTVTGYEGGIQMQYSGNDLRGGMGRPGGMGPMGQMPEDMTLAEGQRPAMPEDFEPSEMPQLPEGETMPADFDPSQMGGKGQRPEGMTPPEGFDGEIPTMPEGEPFPDRQIPEGGFGGRSQMTDAATEPSTAFYMNDKVNAFSGVTAVM